MTAAQFYAWVLGTPLSHFMVGDAWAFTISETLHFIGLCILLGAMLIVDLRLLGLMKSTPVDVALNFLPVAIFGFTINFLTGITFFFSNPEGYATNWMFWLKMSLIILAGLNALYFTLFEQPRVLRTPEGQSFDAQTRVAAALSLLIWVAVIVAGRLLPVTQGEAGTG
ncbi:MAG TPA: DUF6644 family protein [Caulobacterales bacterium]|jgi:hypothetical protein|nr:DUF6644 family protein [Caulobacterales bacterium]